MLITTRTELCPACSVLGKISMWGGHSRMSHNKVFDENIMRRTETFHRCRTSEALWGAASICALALLCLGHPAAAFPGFCCAGFSLVGERRKVEKRGWLGSAWWGWGGHLHKKFWVYADLVAIIVTLSSSFLWVNVNSWTEDPLCLLPLLPLLASSAHGFLLAACWF